MNNRNDRTKLCIDLHNNLAPDLPRSVTDKVFAKAWEDGHANGEHEVTQQYEELLEIARAAHRITHGPAFEVQIDGQYGIQDGTIHLIRDGKEIVMWDSAEWVEDPSLVYVIANAIVTKGGA